MTRISPLKPLLKDDGDALELQEAFEEAFGLKLTDDEASACRSVGDLRAVLVTRFSSRLGERGTCMTSMAFYRLRKSLVGVAADTRLSPASDLSVVVGRRPRAFIEGLSSRSGLTLPDTRLGRLGTLGASFVLLALPTGFGTGLLSEAWHGWVIGLGLIALGALCLKFDDGLMPRDIRTLEDLTRKAVALNFGNLASEGGAVNEDQLWKALVSFLSDATDLPVEKITPETPIL